MQWVFIPGSKPFRCLLWCSYFIMEEAMHEASTSTSTFSEESGDNSEHNVWNLLLCALCHFEIGKIMETFLEDVSLGRCALTCHFALDSQCEQTWSCYHNHCQDVFEKWPYVYACGIVLTVLWSGASWSRSYVWHAEALFHSFVSSPDVLVFASCTSWWKACLQ